MKVLSKEKLMAGGNCKLMELIIEDGGELKSITITSDCIVGHNGTFEEDLDNHLWVAHSDKDIGLIPEEIRAEVLEEFDRLNSES